MTTAAQYSDTLTASPVSAPPSTKRQNFYLHVCDVGATTLPVLLVYCKQPDSKTVVQSGSFQLNEAMIYLFKIHVVETRAVCN